MNVIVPAQQNTIIARIQYSGRDGSGGSITAQTKVYEAIGGESQLPAIPGLKNASFVMIITPTSVLTRTLNDSNIPQNKFFVDDENETHLGIELGPGEEITYLYINQV